MSMTKETATFIHGVTYMALDGIQWEDDVEAVFERVIEGYGLTDDDEETDHQREIASKTILAIYDLTKELAR